MALFKETEEIQKYLPVIGTTEFDSIKMFIEQAERDYLIPNISQELYDELHELYNGDEDLDEEMEKLLEKCQAALAQYFFYLWIPFAQLQIGDNGIRIATTDTLKTAFQWQIDELQRSVLKSAGSAMDALLTFLEKNKDDYESWADSDSYTFFKECFITSATEFTKFFGPLGNSRINFLAIHSSLVKAQEFGVLPEIGQEYYDELLQEHISGDVSEENQKALDLVKKLLTALTMKRAFTELVVTIDERGVINFDNTGTSQALKSYKPAQPNMLTKLEMMCDSDAKMYLQKLKVFLSENIGDYPTYAQSDAYDSSSTDADFKTDSNDTIYNAM